MEQVLVPALRFTLVSALEASAFLAVLVVALRRAQGVSKSLGVLAGVIGLLSAGTYAVAYGAVYWADDSTLLEHVWESELLQQLDWARAIALALLAGAFATAMRARSA